MYIINLLKLSELSLLISYGRAIHMRFMGQDGGLLGAILLRYVKPNYEILI